MKGVDDVRIAFASDDENESVSAVRSYIESHHDLVAVADADSWPTMSRAVAESVATGGSDLGVLMCWTGTGTAISANKVRGIRAATVADARTARGARLWNDANVVALSLKRLAPDVAVECVTAFIEQEQFDPDEAATIDMIRDL
ncbi:RpiB/LacA/LacB family sugar-phosphate isomerase [Phytoactinopolyspora limicola]|uniref:RpiB/LacA/LacB family sugar-phosphate isomerase n=1 Tax=Phytoactinopolyspora limicola TaxID=2715536 RepID=UPI00140CE0B3|nr:RpiB/LacA/LacB family sugar-phosphate isomerase [Phytoactinopolyspora limicola]